ncbi:hypothetical protein BG011_007831 [Mortierella polycephala]|uniref:Peptidase S8/S53 domain-containing protein n=1 Tax=Mortierella polycephala TaxID=41804 RepID=A0A9P6PRN9_9FUNG|nr:hypothetical protein BG011_007831 [Mortierella polycephala]
MKIASLLSLVAAATLVPAGKFHPFEIRPDYQDGVDHNRANSFLNSRKGLSFNVRDQYSQFNSVSIQVKSGHSGEDLAKIPGIKRVWPVEQYQLPKVNLYKEDLTQPHLTTSHKMTGVDYVHQRFKYTDKGIKVGVIDPGVDCSHPALGGRFGRGCRDFAGDNYDKTGVAAPDADPMDNCNGHGAYVVGIIRADARKVGASQPFVGVAPEATFGAYRIFSCKGSGNPNIIMQGMELAYKQAINIKVQFKEPSTGKAEGFPFYSGYVAATPQVKDAIPVRNPYAGVKGDVAKVPISDTDFGVPTLLVADEKTGKLSTIERGHKVDWATEQPHIIS